MKYSRLKISNILLIFIFISPINALAQVHEYELDNGLKLLVKVDRRAPIVITQVWYKVGSSYEYDGITGISHILEHMMFKGTENYAPGEFSRINFDANFTASKLRLIHSSRDINNLCSR